MQLAKASRRIFDLPVAAGLPEEAADAPRGGGPGAGGGSSVTPPSVPSDPSQVHEQRLEYV